MINTFDYVNVAERAQELGCNFPSGLAILPRNFHEAQSKSELLHESDVPTIRMLWQAEGIEETRLEQSGEKFPCICENAATWVGPVIFVGASLISQNQVALSMALNVISNYLTDFFKGDSRPRNVKLSIVEEVTPKKTYRKIEYEGDVEGLKSLPSILRDGQNNG